MMEAPRAETANSMQSNTARTLPSKALFRAFHVTAFSRIHANPVTFVYKRRNLNRYAIFQSRRLVDVRNCRPLHARFSSRYGQFHRGGKIDSNWLPIIKFHLKLQAG